MKKTVEKKEQRRRNGLENEVIMSVIVLYLLIAIVMIMVHYMQPLRKKMETSSMSPSHLSLHNADLITNNLPPQLSQTDIHFILMQGGFPDIFNLRLDGNQYRANAIKDGKTLNLEVDIHTGAIQASQTPTH